ncbi:hypothetical protein B0H19DRAFT_1260177 [Mycena capillaripes]|nr:hypothetical protein B0H19DRAFT_1260177 [Mycena capillaripes]
MSTNPTLLPQNTRDTAAVMRISSLPPSDFAAVVPSLLPWMSWRCYPKYNGIRDPLNEILVSRLKASPPSPNDPIVSAIISVLATPATTTAESDLKHPLLHEILPALSKDRIEPYRAALVQIATNPTETEAEKGSWGPVSQRSAELLEFLDARQAWVPRGKSDDLGLRSLALVQTASEMQPHVAGMLEWLQDWNWPPFSGCWEQLSRFPELALEPIREVLRKGDDGEWSNHLLRFLRECMPEELRERARIELERIVQRPTQTEIENEACEAAMDCLKAMDDWADRAKILSREMWKRDP